MIKFKETLVELIRGEEKMDKVGIITYHGANNYGSLLQTYALLHTVSNKLRKEAEIVNFISEEQKQMYSLFFDNNSYKNICKNIYILFKLYGKRKKKIQKFNEFRENYLKVRWEDSFDSVSLEVEKKYDALLCGSDQIWNMHIDDFYDYYMLSFVNKAKKISYAASMGGVKLNLTEDERKDVKRCLADFGGISVRENIAAEVIGECIGNNIDININIDPVFLLDKEEWNNIASERLIREEYIFFYSIDYNDDSIQIAKWYSQKYNMPVIILNTSWKSYMICKDGIRSSEMQGVQDFLSLIKYAKFILSGSFHGTAFSIIFNKPFYRIQRRSDKGFVVDDRVRTLFSKLNIEKREINIETYKQQGEKIYDIDYTNINKLIEFERNKSMEYLKNAL